MAGESTFKLTFLGDSSKAEAAIGRVDKKAAGLGSTFSTIGKATTGFLAASAVTGAVGMIADQFMAATKAGSDYNEILSKSNTVFKDQAKSVEDWAGTASKSFGQTKAQALDAASGLGNMFIQLDIAPDKAAAMSKQMVELAADFASFHNPAGGVNEVLVAQAAAFRGEYDAVQRFVPTINAAAVQQKALEMGLAKTTKELTMQDKALATQALLLEGAGDAAGDFARTQDSAANKTRTMNARLEEMQTELGVKLLPIQVAFIDFMLKFGIPALGAMATVMTDFLIPAIEDAAAVLKAAWDMAVKFVDAIKEIPGAGAVGTASEKLGIGGAIGKAALGAFPGLGPLLALGGAKSLFGGARASGGPVEAGKMYWVGENGPEPFIPDTSGIILPNELMGGRFDNNFVDVSGVDDRRGRRSANAWAEDTGDDPTFGAGVDYAMRQPVVHITIQGDVLDEPDFVRKVQQALNTGQLRFGGAGY